MPSIEARGILFDLDGVLIDSTPSVTRVWRGWAEEHGFDPDTVIQIAHGRRSIETIAYFAPHIDAAAENREVERRELEDTEDITVFPGAAELLSALPAECWTIVTSGTRALATKRLQVAGLPVPKDFVSADDVAQGKPHPAPFLKGAEKLGQSHTDCVVVEDSPSGIRAAKAAGMRVFAVPTTYPLAELGKADVVLGSFAEFRPEIETENGFLRLKISW